MKLLNTVLCSIPVYFLTAFAPKKWAIKKIDKIRSASYGKGRQMSMEGTAQLAGRELKDQRALVV